MKTGAFYDFYFFQALEQNFLSLLPVIGFRHISQVRDIVIYICLILFRINMYHIPKPYSRI